MVALAVEAATFVAGKFSALVVVPFGEEHADRKRVTNNNGKVSRDISILSPFCCFRLQASGFCRFSLLWIELQGRHAAISG